MKIFDITSAQGYLFDWGDQPDKKNYSGLILSNAGIHSVKGGFGIMVFQNLKRLKYELWYSNYEIKRRIQTISRADVEMIELSFLIQNEIFYQLRQGSIRQKRWQFNIMNSLAMDSKVQFEKDSTYTTLDIHIKVDVLHAFMEEYPQLVGPFLEKIYAKKESLYFDRHHFASRQMIQVIEIITYLISQPVLNGMMLDQAVMLLMGFAIKSGAEMASSKFRYDKEQEIEHMLNQALAKMMSDLKTFRGIQYYAREAGMSDTAFKQNFLKVYGKTPWATWHQERMMHSYTEVISSDKSIFEIAEDFGFEDNASFTKSFKKEFAYSPNFYRKSLSEDKPNSSDL